MIHLLLASWMGLASAHAESVLITAFDPFGGQSFNPSIEIANLAKANLEAQNFTVTVCVIPTVYDKGALKAQECYQNMNPKPRIVLSLGEGAACNLELDIKSKNWDNSYGADNEGVIRRRHVIDPQFGEAIGFNLPIPQMYCSLSPAVRESLRLGNTGDFVCNNTAFHLSHYFENRVAYGFFHVPYAGCSAQQRNPEMIAGQVSELLGYGLTHLPAQDATFDVRLPTTKAEYSEFSARASESGDACLKEFSRRIPSAFRKFLSIADVRF